MKTYFYFQQQLPSVTHITATNNIISTNKLTGVRVGVLIDSACHKELRKAYIDFGNLLVIAEISALNYQTAIYQ